MFRLLLIITLTSSLLLSVSSGAAEKRLDPMKPPAFALKKFKEARNKNKAKVNASKVVPKPTVTKSAIVEPALTLTSILVSPSRRVAIINDQMLVVGESINKAKLMRIEKDFALLVRKGKKITLRLNDDLTAIRKTAVETTL